MQSFRIEPGVPCEICKQNDRQHWRPYQTTKLNCFSEPVSRSRISVTFRSGRWLIRVKIRDVKQFNGYRWIAMK
ncbi:hypothetical protein [Stieleria varia]|uniref:Uncharacterized protein n=1 Tax=Stieleria varia TaxID=2528005 RepID=A0A5C5ZW95_9BACT|nr:hypothetical protein [Stieleria varia]TWT91308.1 hypothetical protein Pla52n_66420 [Stieleria varia]